MTSAIVPARQLPPRTVVVSLTGTERDDLKLGLALWAVGIFAAGMGSGWWLARRSKRRRRS